MGVARRCAVLIYFLLTYLLRPNKQNIDCPCKRKLESAAINVPDRDVEDVAAD